MSMKYATWLVRLSGGSLAGLLAMALSQAAIGQQAVPRAEAPKVAPRAAQRVDRAAKAVPGEAREAARGAAQETREAAREAAGAERRVGEPAGEARETVREGRREARETRREGRQTARAIRDLTGARAADLGLWFGGRGAADGLVIADIAAQGAISTLGFREGDRIVSVNGQRVMTEAEFMRLVMADDIRNERVRVVVLRDGREQVVVVQPSVLVTEVVDYDPLWRYGIVIDDRYPDRIVVQRVYPRTPAYYAGLRAGDVIVSSRGQRLGAVADLVRVFTSADDRVALQVSRGNRTRDLEIDANVDSDVRTTLRPDADADTRLDGRSRTRIEADADRRGDRPADERPNLDRPATERPSADRPAADRPATDRPASERPTTDRPAADRPATPATPATPAAPATPRAKPATPATPATPASPAEKPTDTPATEKPSDKPAEKPARPEVPPVPDTPAEAPPAPPAP